MPHLPQTIPTSATPSPGARLDLLIGIAAAILLHAGFAFGDRLLPSGDATQAAPAEEAIPTIALAPMPQLEPEPLPPEESASSAEAGDLADLAPPMQADTPSPVASTSVFVQKLQPAPPSGLGPPSGVIVIPTGAFGRGGAGGAGLQGLFDLSALDQKPSPRLIVKPAYPFEMRRSNLGGEVLVGLVVDSDGNVRDPFVIRSTNQAFESEALRAVARWKFRPGRKGGVNVSTRNVQIPIVFNLTDNT